MSAARSIVSLPFESDNAWRLKVDIQELCTLRHVSSSGDLTKWWQFLPAVGSEPRRLLMSIKIGSAPPVEVEVPVCTNRHPIPGCWVMVRRNETGWLLTAARLPMDMQRIAHGAPFHADLPVGSISLLDAPTDIAAELASL